MSRRSLMGLLCLIAMICTLTACSADCAWDATGHAWLDANGNGVWDPGEAPLGNVEFHVDDRRNSYIDVAEPALTEHNGQTDLYVWMPGCPKVALEVYAEAPPIYQPTTEERIKVDLRQEDATIQFGFGLRPGVPTPSPTGIEPTTCWSFELLDNQSTTGSGLILDLALAPDGRVWAVTEYAVLELNPVNGNVSSYDQRDGIPHSSIRAIAVSQEGTVWIGTSGEVARLEGSGWVAYPASNDGGRVLIDDIAVAPDGTVWFVGPGGATVYDHDSDTWQYQLISGDDLGSDGEAVGIEAGPDGSLWFATRHSLYQREPSGDWVVHVYGPGDSLAGVSNLWPQSLVFDGVVWISGEAEQGPNVVRYDPATGAAVAYSHASTGGSMYGGQPVSLASGLDGSVWIGLQKGGVLHFLPLGPEAQSGTWIHYTVDDGLPDGQISAIAVDPNGIVWFGSDDLHLIRCLVEQ